MEWNGSTAWVEKIPALTETQVYAMTVFNTKLYTGMAPHGNLYEFT